MKTPYLDWVIQEKQITTSEEKQTNVYELLIQDGEGILNSWAKHLREQNNSC